MPHWLHTFLRILIPGIIILLECFGFYAVAFQQVPHSSEVWSFLASDYGKWTGFAVVAVVLGGLYYFFDVTYKVDDRTFCGMKDIRENIRKRLTEPFRADPMLSGKLDQLEWRTIRRIFFRFIDETPSLKTSNDLAFLSGLAFYSFIDLATISSVVFVASGAALATGFAVTTIRWYMLALGFTDVVSIAGARAAIKRHRDTSDLQLDTILSDHLEELRQRLVASV